MTDTPPTEPQPHEPPPAAPTRRLTRSTDDRLIGGVAGGLGRHLGIDPLALRIGFVVLSFAGGFGILAYLLGLAFIPTDDPDAAPPRWGLAGSIALGLLAVVALGVQLPHWIWGPGVPLLLAAAAVLYVLLRVVRDGDAPNLSRIAARIGIGIALLALAAGGFAAAAAGTALGGGIVIAGLVMACGAGLIAGAFRGGARWLVIPALVLALPLGAVAAADLDVRGTWGDRTFRPATVAEVQHGYDMGVGTMKVDLRDVALPAGRTDMRLQLGVGEIQVLVPAGVCVTTDARIGVGALDGGQDVQGGADVNVVDHRPVAPGARHLHLDTHVGLGAVQVGDRFYGSDSGFDANRFDRLQTGSSAAACRGAA